MSWIPYGYTGAWYEGYIGLLHLRARWYAPGTGTFLSVDPVESEPPYLYVRGNPVSRTDPSGMEPPPPVGTATPCPPSKCKVEVYSTEVGETYGYGRHLAILHTDASGFQTTIEGVPVGRFPTEDERVKQFIIHVLSPRHPVPPSESEFGQLFVDVQDGFKPSVKHNLSLAGPVVVAEGPSACEARRCLANVAQRINEHNFSYWPLTQNSNTAASTLLKNCALPLQYPITTGFPYAFGRDLLLLDNRWAPTPPPRRLEIGDNGWQGSGFGFQNPE